jgi:hypothetical protein
MPARRDPADPKQHGTDTVVDLAAEADRRRHSGGTAARRPDDVPAERQLRFEELLCRAIADRVLVELRYDNEVLPRLFAPHVVYRSTTGKINIAGLQLINPGQPQDVYEPRIFEIGLVRTLRLTDTTFRPEGWADPEDPRYRNGIICSV